MLSATRPRLADDAGFSLTELLVAMGLTTLIMSATLAGLSDVMKSNDLVLTVAQINNSLRTGSDLMIRDFLQAGSGLPSSHTVLIPNGSGSVQVRLPGPPGTTWLAPTGTQMLPAVMTYAGAGPTINGVATDVVSVLMADNSFLDAPLSAINNTSVTVAVNDSTGTAINIATGPDRVSDGQLMMISKGSVNTLVQVTNVNTTTRVLTFANNDSLRLNQSAAVEGSLRSLNEETPVNSASASRISRMRMITYYLDNTTSPGRPRLVRRVNNGDDTTYDNSLGTAVATDVHDLQFTYDISNGLGNPGGVQMTAADIAGGGACGANPCAQTQIRKINFRITAKAMNQVSGANRFLSNTLESQVSLRAMAFVDRFR